MCWIRVGEGCVRMDGTVWNTLKGGGIEKSGGETKILKRGGGKLGQGAGALKIRWAGTPLWPMRSWCKLNFGPFPGQVKSRHLPERIDTRRQYLHFLNKFLGVIWYKTTWVTRLHNDLDLLLLKGIILGYEKYLTLLLTTITFGFSHTTQSDHKKLNLLNLIALLTT